MGEHVLRGFKLALSQITQILIYGSRYIEGQYLNTPKSQQLNPNDLLIDLHFWPDTNDHFLTKNICSKNVFVLAKNSWSKHVFFWPKIFAQKNVFLRKIFAQKKFCKTFHEQNIFI